MRTTLLPVLVVPVVVSLALAACASRTASSLLGRGQLRAMGAAVAGMPCANAIAVTTRDVRNAHDPAVTDQVVETVCPGVTALTYRANSKPGPRLLPVRVVFTQADPRLPPALRVGAPIAGLAAVLGEPKAVTASAWTYPLADDGAGEELIVEHRDGLVTRATWSWGLD